MSNRDEIEIALWDYIDGTCGTNEQHRIATLIATNAEWKQTYEELLQLHHHASEVTTTEEPSMRFTKNVMEAIAHTSITPVTRKYIDLKLVKGIAAFFILTIAGLFGYTLLQLDFSSVSTAPVKDIFSNIPPGTTDMIKNIMIPVNIIAVIVLADEFRSRRLRMKKAGL
ncbi:MAG: hypothetical protein EOP56_12075 [Sphingobacteriales bacterium]|nr:MAG: hypothetical protein EOP56_12075 [Sphingobacteriales bacterium]